MDKFFLISFFKTFNLNSSCLETPVLPHHIGLSFHDALLLVLRLPAVASKRYLTNKVNFKTFSALVYCRIDLQVDRSVTGLVVQQQCVGPLHTPLADVAVTALSYFDKVCKF